MVDVQAWRIWWKTKVVGIPARVLLRAAVRAKDFERAAKIKEETGVELEDEFLILE